MLFLSLSPRSFHSLVAALLLVPLVGCGGTIESLITPPAASPSSPVAAVKSGPQLGYIWSDAAHTLRPVLGIAGSAQLGQSLIAENVYVAAAGSNLSGLALLQESDGVLDLMTLPSGQPLRLSASLTPGATLRFAPSGLCAIAFLPGQDTLILLTNLLASPKAATLTLPQPLSDAAVSDAGSVAAALPNTAATDIRTVSPGGTSNLIATVTTLGGITFAGTGESLLVTDAAANTLTLIRASTSAPSATLLRSDSLLKSPQGLGASHDGRWAILANSADPSIVLVDLTAQLAPRRLACDCQPSLVAPLSGAGVFRITKADTCPVWIFDAAATTPRVLFIPASSTAAASKAGSH